MRRSQQAAVLHAIAERAYMLTQEAMNEREFLRLTARALLPEDIYLLCMRK